MSKKSTKTILTTDCTDELLLASLNEMVDEFQELKSDVKEIRDLVKRIVGDAVKKVIKPAPEKIYTEEAYEFLEISETTFYEHVYNRLLFPIKIGIRNYFIREELYDLLRRRKETRTPYRLLEPINDNELDQAA